MSNIQFNPRFTATSDPTTFEKQLRFDYLTAGTSLPTLILKEWLALSAQPNKRIVATPTNNADGTTTLTLTVEDVPNP